MKVFRGVGIFFFLSLSIVVAQPPVDDEHKPPQSIKNNFIEAPLKRPTLNNNLAKVSFPLSNMTEEGQKFFDQGIAAMHGFWTYEAERNFLEAARLKPSHPLPYAFAAYAQVVFKSGDAKRAQKYIQLAIEKRKDDGLKLKWDEVRWLESIQQLFNHKAPKEQQKDFIESLTEMVKRNEHPDIVM